MLQNSVHLFICTYKNLIEPPLGPKSEQNNKILLHYELIGYDTSSIKYVDLNTEKLIKNSKLDNGEDINS